MADTHQHPETERKVHALEERLRKLEQDFKNLVQKFEKHDHPHERSKMPKSA